MQDFLFGKFVNEENNKCKHVHFLEFFYINWVVLSVTSRSITITSLISAIVVPSELVTLFIIPLFTLSNTFLKLFLSKLKSKNQKVNLKRFKY